MPRSKGVVFGAIAAIALLGVVLAVVLLRSAHRAEGQDYAWTGADTAPVRVVMFGSFSCGDCGKLYSQSIEHLKAQYINKGLVRFSYRDFPLDDESTGLAEFVQCLGPSHRESLIQSLYDPSMQATLYGLFNSDKLKYGQFLGMFGQTIIGLSADEVGNCLVPSSDAAHKFVQQEVLDGNNIYHLQRVPAVVINDGKANYIATYADLDGLIKQALAHGREAQPPQ